MRELHAYRDFIQAQIHQEWKRAQSKIWADLHNGKSSSELFVQVGISKALEELGEFLNASIDSFWQKSG